MPSENPTTWAEEVGLTDADMDRAFATAVSRGGQLVHQRHRRQAIATGFAAVALVGGGFGVVRSLADSATNLGPQGGNPTTTAEAATTTTVAVKLEPIGFSREVRHDSATGLDVVTLTNSSLTIAPSTTLPADGGPNIGSALTEVRPAEIVSHTVHGSRIHLEFACVRNTYDHIDEVQYVRDGETVRVDADITNDSAGGPACVNGVGATIDIDLTDGDLHTDAQIISVPVAPR